ncbi:MAG TPA: hypothetical protein ENG83_05755 [Nitrospirae bacterium]|nr:hypothetical protein BMS3Abin06_01781 [bacterium BMS3Abin06]HDH11688.1 hypothetical protein [Nitrospirota bacterium]HDZ01938.1 hypothetical protein [Nitrospirota bacterium]
MSKQTERRPGFGKLLDAWTPPINAGEPVGCVATTFSFSPVFFEEECLSRFLSLDTDPQEDDPLYLIEREEKLSGLSCAGVLVDQHKCKGLRSLRWDLLSARVPDSILHAKISLLYWSNLIRLLIASANLTDDSYRRNQEIFGVIDVKEGVKAPLTALKSVIEFLRETASYTVTGTDKKSPALNRWKNFLNTVSTVYDSWITTEPSRSKKYIWTDVVLTGPGRPNAFEQLKDRWSRYSPPTEAHIVSPFFDPPGAENKPAKKIWTILKQRGKANVTYYVKAEKDIADDVLNLHAPESLKKAAPSGRGLVKTDFEWIKETFDEKEEKYSVRPLHMKAIWLDNENWISYMIGSSNFTSPGLGISNNPNLEANLVYSAHMDFYNKLGKSYPDSQKIGADITIYWKPVPDDEDSPDEHLTPLHPFFDQAIYICDEKKKAYIDLSFNANPPEQWIIYPFGGITALLTISKWKQQGSPKTVRLPWDEEQPLSGLEVSWKDASGRVWWQVNIDSPLSLMPPLELRELPLEVLIHVLTSARPLHQILKKWLKRKHQPTGDTVIDDPHKRVDTSAFLLQRTRRISWALKGLKERLERPFLTEESLQWRLYGPVGVQALAKAITREAKSEYERCFLLAELALELSRIKPKGAPESLAPAKVKKKIYQIIGELQTDACSVTLKKIPQLNDYIRSTFNKVRT